MGRALAPAGSNASRHRAAITLGKACRTMSLSSSKRGPAARGRPRQGRGARGAQPIGGRSSRGRGVPRGPDRGSAARVPVLGVRPTVTIGLARGTTCAQAHSQMPPDSSPQQDAPTSAPEVASFFAPTSPGAASSVAPWQGGRTRSSAWGISGVEAIAAVSPAASAAPTAIPVRMATAVAACSSTERASSRWRAARGRGGSEVVTDSQSLPGRGSAFGAKVPGQNKKVGFRQEKV